MIFSRHDAKDEELAIVMLRALGYEPVAWGGNIELLTNKTNIEIAQSKQLTRGQAFDALWIAVSTNVAADGSVLGVTLGKLQPATPDKLEITNVAANNLKEIFVNFNQPVDKDNLGEFSINISGAKITAELVDDSTVKLSLDKTMANQKEYKLGVKATKAVSGVELDEVKDLVFKVFDAEMPRVENVEFTGPKHITVTFSEPIDKTVAGSPEFKLGNSSVYANPTKTKVEGNVVTLELYTSLQEDKEYAITIKGYKDFAGYENIIFATSLTYVKNTESPTFEVVSANQEEVVLKFSKPVKGLKADYFSHTFSSYHPKKLSVTASEFTTKVTLTFWDGASSDKALPEGSVKFSVNGAGIVDLWGNKLVSEDITLTISGDNEKPEITKVEVKSASSLEATFSEAVVLKAENVTIKKDSKNVNVTVAAVADKGNKVWTIGMSGVSEGNTIEISISGAKDKSVNANTMIAYSDTITIEDKTPPMLDKITFSYPKVGDPATIQYWFSEPLDSSALDIANFSFHVPNVGNLDNLAIAGASEFVVGEQAVKVVISNKTLLGKMFSSVDALIPSSYFGIKDIKDTAGNKISNMSIAVSDAKVIKEAAHVAGAKKAVITAPNKFYVEFDRQIKAIKTSDLKVEYATSAELAPEDFAVAGVEGKVVSFEITSSDATKRFALDGKNASFEVKSFNEIATIEDLPVASGSISIVTDTIAPEFVIIKGSGGTPDTWKAAAANNGSDTDITIDFTEKISLSDHEAVVGKAFTIPYREDETSSWKTVSVYGTEYELATFDDKLTITIKGWQVETAGYQVKVTFKGSDLIVDSEGNKLVKPNVLEFEYTHP